MPSLQISEVPNMLPEFISMIARKDIVEATIKTAMGETADLDVSLDGEEGGYWWLGVLHTLHRRSIWTK